MSDTFTSNSNKNWFRNSNWTSGGTQHAPAITATGAQNVIIDGKTVVISPTVSGATDISVAQTLNTGGISYTVLEETQIGGEIITLSGGADLNIQGVAMGIFYGNTDTLTPAGTTMTGLHGALTATPHADMHMQISVVGTDTLSVDTVNENFGFITIGNGDTLNLDNITTGGNQQALHGLINYGILSISSGGELNITATNASNSTLANFYNAGWIVDNGGTLSISSSVLDGASTLATNGGVDGFIEVGGGGLAILSNTVSTAEQVDFTDNAHNTLQIAAGTLFSGTVNNFGAGNTLLVSGFTSTSNATLTNVGGVKELITTNGNVITTVTLTGSVSSNFSTTLSGGNEVISAGGNALTGNTTYASGSNTLAASSGNSLTNTGTLAATGSGTTLAIDSNVGGTGTIFIDYGATVALDNATGNDSGQTALFGTHGAAGAMNTLLVNDNSSGFGGPVSGFGANDDIVLGGSALPAFASGDGVTLNFNSATGVLTVTETGSTGNTVGTSTLTFTGASGLSTSSFVALEGSTGLNIELAPTASTTYDFSASSTGSFENYHNYTGGVAPGDALSTNTTVAVIAGTAAVSASTLSDNGLITVAAGTGFVDAGTLAGTGKLVVGGTASLTGNTSLASITDNGSLVVGGTVSGPITIASGANAAVAGSLVDTGALSGAGTLTVGAGNSATLSGGAAGISVADNGSLTVAGSVSSNITGTGTLDVASGTSATLAGVASLVGITDDGALTLGSAYAGSINMGGNGAGSAVDITGADVTSGVLNTTITNLGYHDTVALGGANFTLSGSSDALSESYNSSTGVVTIHDATNGQTLQVTLGLASGDNASLLHVSEVNGQVELTLCFYPGTALATPAGEMLVEELKAGDMVMTAKGAMPVRWIGHNHIHTRFADPLRSLPIRIRQGALGGGLPERDLLLSPDHAIFMDGILAHASALVNGTSIVREYDVPEQFTYYHVELETHELLLAEGVQAESFVDNVDRMHFHNWDERTAPDAAVMEMDLPRAKSARQVPMAIKRRLGLNQFAVA